MASNQDTNSVPQGWSVVGKTGAVTRRFEFSDYAATSAFLDKVNALSEETGVYPDLGFATTYVNVTVPAGDAGATDARDSFAARANAFYAGDSE